LLKHYFQAHFPHQELCNQLHSQFELDQKKDLEPIIMILSDHHDTVLLRQGLAYKRGV